MSQMPDRVKVGALTYSVVDYTMRESMEYNRQGECRHDTLEIAVADWVSDVIAADILWHEIGHAIWYRWNIPDPCEEEVGVDSFTKGLLTVWMDNPELVAWTEAALLSQTPSRSETPKYPIKFPINTKRGPHFIHSEKCEIKNLSDSQQCLVDAINAAATTKGKSATSAESYTSVRTGFDHYANGGFVRRIAREADDEDAD